MINKNLVSFFAATSMVLSMSAFSVNAAAETGITLEYVASNVATERTVKVYYTGSDLADGVSGCEIYLNVEGADIENATITLPANTSTSKFDTPDAPMIDGGSIFFCLFSDGGVTAADNELATLTFTVPENTGDFTVSVDTAQSYLFDATAEIFVECDEESIIIPGAKPAEETIAASEVGSYTYWDDAAISTFKAVLTAEQAAKSVTWVVTDGTTTKSAAANVNIEGGSDVILGLMVENAVEGLTASVVVK